MNGQRWLIWSNEHDAWWGADEKGYVQNVRVAGRYSFFRAIEIVTDANRGTQVDPINPPNEAMVLDNEKYQ